MSAFGVTILGLTGSIAMGKSAAARMFRRLGVWVFDADAVVHRLLGPGGAAVAPVLAAFPGVGAKGAVDRRALGARVFADTAALERLEAILHPLVGEARRRFLRRAGARRRRLVVLDVPLLLEAGGAGACDYVAVISAPAFLQRGRALRRPGMTAAKLDAILARQMPDREKRRRADFVIPSGLGKRVTLRAIREIVTMLTAAKTGGGVIRRRRIHARNRPRHRNHRA